MKRRTFAWTMAIWSMLAVSFGHAPIAQATTTATDVVQTKQTALFDLLRKPSAGNQAKVAQIFDEMLDYGAFAEASLGTEWAARSDAEKAEFSDLLKQLVRKAYERNLKKTLDFKMEYVAEEPAGQAIMVKTKAISHKNSREEPIEIDFKMLERNGTWKVVDIVTEGVSIVSNYKSQFTKIIKKDGFPKLISKMKDKLAKGDV